MLSAIAHPYSPASVNHITAGRTLYCTHVVLILTLSFSAQRAMAGITGTAEHPAELQNAPSLAQLKEGLLLSYAQCSERGLIHSANWLVRSSTSYLRVYFSGY